MSPEYEAALEIVNAATREFHKVRDAYRSRKIGDREFLAARAIYNAAEKVFDEAFDKEARS